jgi:hypothetical protein
MTVESEFERELVGHVRVDTLGLAIIDHVHVHDDTGERIGDELIYGRLEGPGFEVRNEHDAPIAVWSFTGVGDGTYPVYADIWDTPAFGRLVARIVIDCMGVEDDSDDVRRYLRDVVLPRIRGSRK